MNKDISHHETSKNPSGPSTWDLIGQTVMVMLTSAVPLYGVLELGWNAFILVLMFILEGVIVLCADAVKLATRKIQRPKAKAVFTFQFVFIFFFGFFALLVFGPADTESFSAKYRLVKSLFADQIQTPLLTLIGFRMLRLIQDLIAGGVFGSRFFKRPLELSGGGWMLLLFFAVMLTPFIANTGPNPLGGLAALVILRMLGEILGVWIVRIASRIK